MPSFSWRMALASGLLWTLAWPAVGGLFPLALIAWVPLMYGERACRDQRAAGKRPRFLLSVYVACLIWNASTTWWLGAVEEPWSTRIVSGGFPMFANSALMVLPWWLKGVVHRRIGPREARWGFILFWLTFEHLHFDWDLSWPWLTIGNVFAEHPHWVQWYDLTGVLGGSLWILVVNMLVFDLLERRRATDGRHRWRAIALLSVFLLPLIFSQWRYASIVPLGRPIEVVIVQPNLDPYEEKFGGIDPIAQLDRMLAQADGAMTDSTALVVLPETALQEDATVDRTPEGELALHGLWENVLPGSRSVKVIADFLQGHPDAAVLTGMSSAYLLPRGQPLPKAARKLGGTDRYYVAYNAALLVDPQGQAEPYHKSKLVAGVELMPFESVLAPLGDISLDFGGTSGSLGTQDEREVMRTTNGRINAAPIICYESVFPDHVAAHVRNGATLLVIMTNDGWWGDSPGYRQHLAYGRLRAIETRRDVARCANTGISCIIDQRGDVHHATGWWEPAAIRGAVLANERLTFFTRHGDQIGRVSIWFSGLLILYAFAKWIRGSRHGNARPVQPA